MTKGCMDCDQCVIYTHGVRCKRVNKSWKIKEITELRPEFAAWVEYARTKMFGYYYFMDFVRQAGRYQWAENGLRCPYFRQKEEL